MKRSIARWTTVCAAAALLTLPMPSVAQEPQPASPTQQPQSPASPTPAQDPASPAAEQPQPTPAMPQVDTETVKRHLTAARDTLSQLTQLPAAAQLQGEPRTQVSQLIMNFNELITTKENWRASYDKVAANLTTLLGADTPAATPEPAAPPAGVPGAVGTSGTATLDPAIRAKLVEFRTHLSQFEKAAGSAPAESSAAAATPSAPSATPSAPSATPSAPSSTPSAPSAAPSTPPAEQSAATPQRSESMGQNTALGHVDAIEAILNARAAGSTQAPASGGITLDTAQVEQLRSHLAQLRKALEKK